MLVTEFHDSVWMQRVTTEDASPRPDRLVSTSPDHENEVWPGGNAAPPADHEKTV